MVKMLGWLRNVLKSICSDCMKKAIVWFVKKLRWLWNILDSLCPKCIKKAIAWCWDIFNPFLYSPKELGEFTATMIIGVVTYGILWCISDTELSRTVINKVFDRYIIERMKLFNPEKHTFDSSKEIIFFDIDREAVEQLNHPFFTPRGILAALIQYAENQKAKLILLDVNLTVNDSSQDKINNDNNSQYEGNSDKDILRMTSGNAGDELLFKVLANIGKSSDTNVLIPKKSYADRKTKNSFLLKMRFNDLSLENSHIFWVSPHFASSDEDPYKRFWKPYDDVINEKEEDEILWTMPFMAAALYAANESDKYAPYAPYDAIDSLNALGRQLIEIKQLKIQLEEGMEEVKRIREQLKEKKKTLYGPWRSNETDDLKERIKNFEKQLDEIKLLKEQLENQTKKLGQFQEQLAQMRDELKYPWRNGSFVEVNRSHDTGNPENEFIVQKHQRNRIEFEFLSDYSPFLDSIHGNLNDMDKKIHKQIYHWRKEIMDGDDAGKYIPLSFKMEGKEIFKSYLRLTTKGPGASARGKSKEENTPAVNCKDKIVIIGGSDENDCFWTPVDQMPGMYVHGNIIATLLGKQKLPHLVGDEWLFIWNLFFLFLSSCVAVKCPDWITILWTILFPLCFNVIFFIYFFKTNTFIFAGVACLGITLYDTVLRSFWRWHENR